jgi:hypothetical protein
MFRPWLAKEMFLVVTFLCACLLEALDGTNEMVKEGFAVLIGAVACSARIPSRKFQGVRESA